MDDIAAEIHWKSLCLALPPNGVAKTFRTEEECVRRLVEVRFPHGVTCPKCEASEVSPLSTRQFYHCKKCRCQFSARQGTVFERSNLPLRIWFLGTEIAINAHAAKKLRISYSISSVMRRLSVARGTAVRLRTVIADDLLQDRGGILGRCVAFQHIDFPETVESETFEHLSWLDAAIERRRHL